MKGERVLEIRRAMDVSARLFACLIGFTERSLYRLETQDEIRCRIHAARVLELLDARMDKGNLSLKAVAAALRERGDLYALHILLADEFAKPLPAWVMRLSQQNKELLNGLKDQELAILAKRMNR